MTTGGHHSHEHTPHSGHGAGEPPSAYGWRVYHPYGDSPDLAAVEVSPKRGLLPRWRFVIPHDYTAVRSWGVGPPGGGPIDEAVTRPVKSGPTRLVNGPAVVWFGGHEALSSRLSAYMVFDGPPPHYLAFGQADVPGGPPLRLEGISFGVHQPPHSHDRDGGEASGHSH